MLLFKLYSAFGVTVMEKVNLSGFSEITAPFQFKKKTTISLAAQMFICWILQSVWGLYMDYAQI